MSVGMSNCGAYGWVTDAAGYRYSATNPDTGVAWPAMPDFLHDQAVAAAAAAGYPGYAPDVCLVNQYLPGARMGLHRDADEQDWAAPIVSVSLGLPCRIGDPAVGAAVAHAHRHGLAAGRAAGPQRLQGQHLLHGGYPLRLLLQRPAAQQPGPIVDGHALHGLGRVIEQRGRHGACPAA